MEAEEFDEQDLCHGAGHFCFHFGIGYGAKLELPIQEAINETLSEVV